MRRNRNPRLESSVQRQIRRIVPTVVESSRLAEPVARILVDKVPLLAKLAVSAAAARGVPVQFSDEVLSTALSAHAEYMLRKVPSWQDLPRQELRRILLSLRPYCSDAPDLFWPFCKLGPR